MRAELTNAPDTIATRAVAFRRKSWLDINYQEFGWALLFCDFSLIVVLSISSGVAYHGSAFGMPGDLEAYVGAGFVVGGFFVACQKASGLYDPISLIERSRCITRTVAVWAFVFTFFATAAFLLKITDSFSRGTMILWFASGLVAISGTREVAARLFAQGLENGALQGRRVLAICDPEEAADSDLDRLLRRVGYEVGRVFVAPNPNSSQWLALIEDVRKAVRGQDVAEVLVCVSWHQKARVDALVSALRILPVPVRLIPDRELRPFLSESLMRVGATFGVEVQRAPLTRAECLIKRAFDLACASVGLMMLLPLLGVVALAIKLDSRGPVLFRQYRTGFNGRTFSIYKFRTMTTMENGSQVRQATRNDARITRVGRMLRCTSIDELPQLLNVLAGHMSLVGPRPHAVAHDDHYSEVIADYAMRQHVKPGITGWAQVNGLRGETAEVDLMRRRVEHDLWYISNWSFTLDIKIIIRTCVQCLNSKDAY
jgi:Undecaprenyl-phosphate glucose phosphotransferase